MKLIILEGCDRTGKNSIINALTRDSQNSIVRHFGSAHGSTDSDKRRNQFLFFSNEMQLAQSRSTFSIQGEKYKNDLYCWNRSHLGELVYGQLYRNTHPQEWIYNLEKLYGFDIDPGIFLILLQGNSKVLCNNDDGDSFSSKKEQKDIEQEYFYRAYMNSTIVNKKIIQVTDEFDYVNFDIILNEAKQFIYGV